MPRQAEPDITERCPYHYSGWNQHTLRQKRECKARLEEEGRAPVATKARPLVARAPVVDDSAEPAPVPQRKQPAAPKAPPRTRPPRPAGDSVPAPRLPRPLPAAHDSNGTAPEIPAEPAVTPRHDEEPTAPPVQAAPPPEPAARPAQPARPPASAGRRRARTLAQKRELVAAYDALPPRSPERWAFLEQHDLISRDITTWRAALAAADAEPESKPARSLRGTVPLDERRRLVVEFYRLPHGSSERVAFLEEHGLGRTQIANWRARLLAAGEQLPSEAWVDDLADASETHDVDDEPPPPPPRREDLHAELSRLRGVEPPAVAEPVHTHLAKPDLGAPDGAVHAWCGHVRSDLVEHGPSCPRCQALFQEQLAAGPPPTSRDVTSQIARLAAARAFAQLRTRYPGVFRELFDAALADLVAEAATHY